MKSISLKELANTPVFLEYLQPIKVTPKLEVDNYYYPDTPSGHLLYSFAGEASYIYKSKITHIRPGALYYIPTGSDPHFNENVDYEYIKIYFKLIETQTSEEIILSDDISELIAQCSESLKTELFSLCYVFSSENISVFRQNSLFFSLLDNIYMSSQMESVKPSGKASALAISPALVHIQHNFKYNFSTKELADMCALSESHFRKLFREAMQVSPTEYRNFLRINFACTQLKTSNYTISYLADLAGFDNITHFYRQFKHFIGLSPSEYRQKVGIGNAKKIKEYDFE